MSRKPLTFLKKLCEYKLSKTLTLPQKCYERSLIFYAYYLTVNLKFSFSYQTFMILRTPCLRTLVVNHSYTGRELNVIRHSQKALDVL